MDFNYVHAFGKSLVRGVKAHKIDSALSCGTKLNTMSEDIRHLTLIYKLWFLDS